jgi:hypothetical protein
MDPHHPIISKHPSVLGVRLQYGCGYNYQPQYISPITTREFHPTGGKYRGANTKCGWQRNMVGWLPDMKSPLDRVSVLLV